MLDAEMLAEETNYPQQGEEYDNYQDGYDPEYPPQDDEYEGNYAEYDDDFVPDPENE